MDTESARWVAVLCASTVTAYKLLPHVSVWDHHRNAWLFPGGMPVIGHPPCAGWSRYRARPAEMYHEGRRLGLWCVHQVLCHGGVIEQPAGSELWQFCHLPAPGSSGWPGLWSMSVRQSWWGFPTVKRTWLLFCGVPRGVVRVPLRLRVPGHDGAKWASMTKGQRSATVLPLARWLVEVARMVEPQLREEAADAYWNRYGRAF